MSGQADSKGSGAAGGEHARLQKVKHAAIDEGRRYVISFVYIYILLGMFTLHEEMALRAHGGSTQAIPFAPHFFALVNALVLAKVALVVEDLRLAPRIKARPLIYPIVIEAALLAVLFIAMHVLEHVVSGLIHGERLAASVPAVGGGGAIGMAFAAFSFFVPMIPFCAFRQLTLEIGWPRIRALLFGTPEDAPGKAER
jgi:hypothetical protein